MNHPDRVFSFKELESEDDLVQAMTNHTWPLCYGFYYGKLLYLSDGSREDAPEYAAVTIDSTEGHHGGQWAGSREDQAQGHDSRAGTQFHQRDDRRAIWQRGACPRQGRAHVAPQLRAVQA